MSNKTERIGVIGAMEIEIEGLRAQMEEVREETVSGVRFTSGTLCGREVVLCVCGIGKVFAAIAAEAMILHFGVTALINTGVAGSLNNALDIGDIVLSSCAQEHDMDVSPLGDPVGIIPRMEQSIFTADETLVSLAKSACEKANPDIHCHIGKVVSGDQFIASAEKKNYLIETFHGDCAEMEGAAMAHTAYLNNVPFLIIRAISDKADNSGHMDYPVFAKQAIIHTVSLLKELYQHL